MTDKHTPGPRYFLTELNDGIQWLTDGHDFGMNPDAAPEMLSFLKNIQLEASEADESDNPYNVLESIDKMARAAIKAAKGDA